MRNSRKYNEIRKPSAVINFCRESYGSLLFEMGNTRVICAASLSTEVPLHAVNKETGWLSAEYTLLPYSTNPRTKRDILKKDGRSIEIQRLIARSLRCAVDLRLLQGYFIEIDCDVLQADGGTRTASITAGYIALKLAIERMLSEGKIDKSPLISHVAAISAGFVDKQLLLDLDYREDSNADVDMNIVMNNHYDLIEIQGTGEGSTFSIEQMDELIDLSKKGIMELIDFQNSF